MLGRPNVSPRLILVTEGAIKHSRIVDNVTNESKVSAISTTNQFISTKVLFITTQLVGFHALPCMVASQGPKRRPNLVLIRLS